MVGAMLIKWGTRRHFALMNRKDVAALMRDWAGDGVFEFPGHTPVSGRHAGKRAIAAFYQQVFDQMAVIRFRVKRVAVTRPFAWGLTNTALCEWVVDVTSYDGITNHAGGVTVIDIRHGRALAARDYIFDTGLLGAISGHVEVTPPAVARQA